MDIYVHFYYTTLNEEIENHNLIYQNRFHDKVGRIVLEGYIYIYIYIYIYVFIYI